MVELATVRPCEGSSAIEVLPAHKLRLDLGRCADHLREAGLEVVDAKALLVVTGKLRVTLFPSGRMLVHTGDATAARSWALEVYDMAEVRGG